MTNKTANNSMHLLTRIRHKLFSKARPSISAQDMEKSDIENKNQSAFYFAYGSNLSTKQMRSRCPNSTPIGLAYLDGFNWIINERGYANVVPSGNADPVLDIQNTHHPRPTTDTSGSSRQWPSETEPEPGVFGLVYDLPPEDERVLDRYEGVGYAYEKAVLEITWSAKQSAQHAEKTTSGAEGEKLQALVYIDSQRVTPSVPREEYIGRMNVGIEETSTQWGLPDSYVNRVIRPYIPAPVW